MQKRILLGLAGLCAVLLFSWSANASHIDVNSTDDGIDNEDGKCTLREAVKVANSGVTFGKAAGECVKTGLGLLERISLPAGTYVLTEGTDSSKGNYESASSIDEDDTGIKGDLDILASYDIVGEGSKSTIISGHEEGSKVFDVMGGTTVTISGVTIKKGYGWGGGIANSGTLTLNDCVVTDNSSLEWGGGIFNAGSLILSDCKVTKNSAELGGGGIYNKGITEIKDSTISDNSATDADADGGGIANFGTLVVSDSTISDNTSKGSGGIGTWSNSNTTITNSFISGNKVTGSGGAIGNGGTLEIKNSTFTKNVADKQGNVIYNGKEGYVSITHSTIHYNVGGSGIAIFNNSSGGNFVLQNVILLVNASNECEGEFTSNGGNIIGSVPNCFIKLKQTDKTYQTSDKIKFGTFVDLGKPGMAYYPLLAGAIALGAAEKVECEKLDQVHRSRKAKCDSGAIEAACGDGIVHGPDEECDDGNDKDNDACRNDCKSAKCGDGVVYAKNEACDDGNTIDTDGCNNSCKMVNTFECATGYKWDSVSKTCSLPPGACPSGKIMNKTLGCTSCAGEGEEKSKDGKTCLCKTGYEADVSGCIKKTCPVGQALNISTGKCAPKITTKKATPR